MTRRRIGITLTLAACAAALSACSGTASDGGDHDGGAGGFEIHIKDLSGKSFPVAMEEDGDAKDVKAKSRGKFKPSKGSETGLDKRYTMQAKRDDAVATVVYEYETSGDMTTWVRVAVDKLDGLVDGASCAFFEHRPGVSAADDGVRQRLDAMWTGDGFEVRAREGDKVVGTPASFPGKKEIFLIIEDSGSSANLYAAEATGEGSKDYGPWQMIHSGAVRDPFTIAFGVEGLDKKGTIYFADFTVQANGNVNIGTAELSVAQTLYPAVEKLRMIQMELDMAAVLPMNVNNDLQSALFDIDNAINAMSLADFFGALNPKIPADDIWDELWDAQWHTNAAWENGSGYSGSPKLKKIAKFVDHAVGHCELAIAFLSGWKGKKLKKTEKLGSVETYGYAGAEIVNWLLFKKD